MNFSGTNLSGTNLKNTIMWAVRSTGGVTGTPVVGKYVAGIKPEEAVTNGMSGHIPMSVLQCTKPTDKGLSAIGYSAFSCTLQLGLNIYYLAIRDYPTFGQMFNPYGSFMWGKTNFVPQIHGGVFFQRIQISWGQILKV